MFYNSLSFVTQLANAVTLTRKYDNLASSKSGESKMRVNTDISGAC